jgi:hypothetical protein
MITPHQFDKLLDCLHIDRSYLLTFWFGGALKIENDRYR